MHLRSDLQAAVDAGTLTLRLEPCPPWLDARELAAVLVDIVRLRISSPAENGGGEEHITLVEMTPRSSGWRVILECSAGYQGWGPAFDPPWGRDVHIEADLDTELKVVCEPSFDIQTQH